MQFSDSISAVIKKNNYQFHPVITINPGRKIVTAIDLSAGSTPLQVVENEEGLAAFVQNHLTKNKALYAVGGYAEIRNLYTKSALFSDASVSIEPRTLHIGTDVWCDAGTAIYAFAGGMVHSFAFNNHIGDYGATLILLHQLEGIPFYTLYGHISLADIENIKEGDYVNRGQLIAHVGNHNENGNWPPHLHFQLINDIEMKKGDYPGVCRLSEKDYYLNNCPDPDIILQLLQYTQ